MRKETCPRCGNRVRTLVPVDGDDSTRVLADHLANDGVYCRESRTEVRSRR